MSFHTFPGPVDPVDSWLTSVPRLAAQFANNADAPSFLDCANAEAEGFEMTGIIIGI